MYDDFLAAHLRLHDERLEPRAHARHALSVRARTPRGTRLSLETGAVASGVAPRGRRRVESALVCESQWNPLTTSRVCLSSSRRLSLHAQLQTSDALCWTLDAHETATEKVPLSFARLGAAHAGRSGCADVRVDMVNGPTVAVALWRRWGRWAAGGVAAYDVGLDRSDRRGRCTTFDVSASYVHDELSTLLQVYVEANGRTNCTTSVCVGGGWGGDVTWGYGRFRDAFVLLCVCVVGV